jgi:hypothetical protein
MQVALAAIQRAGRKDRAAIRDAVFATQNYDGVLGAWSFDQNGDTTLTAMSGRQVVAGRFDEAHAVVLAAPGWSAAEGPQVDPLLLPAWQALEALPSSDGELRGPRLRGLLEATGVRLAVGWLPDMWGTYWQVQRVVMISHLAGGEDPRTLAAVLAHELTHVEQAAARAYIRVPCLDLEIQATVVGADAWLRLWDGPGPTRTVLERQLNQEAAILLSEGQPGLDRHVRNNPGYQNRCRSPLP